MTDSFVNSAKDSMGAIERLLKGLPGIRGYVDKELRRDADKRLREYIAAQLTEQKQELLNLQQRLLKGGGLLWLDDMDGAVTKLQTLVDRIRTASYGYAGLFDPVKIREEQLNALHRFDVALAARVADVQNAIASLRTSVTQNEGIGQQIQALVDLVSDLNLLFNRRHEAVVSPDLLLEPSYTPDVDPSLLDTSES
jgi:hypothetical protein